jgi:hypothetical protein
VFVYYWNAGNTGASRITGVTYNGVALTRVAFKVDGGSALRSMDCWYLLNPATGSHTIAVSGSDFGDKQGVGLSVADAVQSAPTAFSANGNGTAISTALTGTVNDLFLDGAGFNQVDSATMAAGGSQTQRSNFTAGNNQRMGASTVPGTTSLAMTWTISATREWAQIAVAVSHV